jgi:ADP-ribose pyrophosphatase YjhB (NUDIX family)
VSGNHEPPWLRWAKELHALAQAGLTYSENHFDLDRYRRLREIAAEIMASGGAIGAGEMLEVWRLEEGYATPKVDVRAVVLDDGGRVLLVQEKSDGLWTLPGGWADPNDSPRDVAAREVREEASVEVRPVRLLALLDRTVQGHTPLFPFHVYKAFILCEWLGGDPAPGSETAGAGWFEPANLPPLSLGRILPQQIARMVELAAEPSTPPDLD